MRVYDNMSLKLSNNLLFINYILIKTFFFLWDSHLIPNKLSKIKLVSKLNSFDTLKKKVFLTINYSIFFMKLIIQYYKNNVAVSTHK